MAPSRVSRRGERVLEAIATLGHSTGSNRDLNDYLTRVAASVCEALDYRMCAIYLFDSFDDTFYAEATYGIGEVGLSLLLSKPVPRRILEQLMVETYRLDWSFYVPATAASWKDPEVAACFARSRASALASAPDGQPCWRPGDLFLVPLETTRNEPIGFLVIDEPIDGRFPDSEALLGIATLAKSCANAIESAHLYKLQSEEAAISAALLQVSEAVRTPDQNMLFTRAGMILTHLFVADACAALYLDDSAIRLHLVAGTFLWDVSLFESLWGGEDGLRLFLVRGEPSVVYRGERGTNALVARLEVAAALFIPLFLDDVLAGAIIVGWADAPHRLRVRDLDIARGVSRLVGMALHNVRLYQDTTRQSERNAELYRREREAVQRLQELDQLRNDFVSTVSHELRTPLTGIKGFTETLINYWERMDDARRLAMIERISSSSHRLERLVHDLLFVSRIESGVLPLHLSVTALQPLIDGAIQEVESKYRGQAIQLRPPAEEIHILADPDRVQQVIVNLLDNGAKYSLEGRPIRVRWWSDRRVAHIAVVDCGAGIAVDDFARLFTRFGKLTSMPRAGHVGTGLGLYISKSLVEAMGGSIGVESRPGRGTVFHFTVPLSIVDAG